MSDCAKSGESIPDMHWRLVSQPSPWYELVKDPSLQGKILKALDKAIPESEPNPDWTPATDDSPPGLTIASLALDLENVRSLCDLSIFLSGICQELTRQLAPNGLSIHHSPTDEEGVDRINVNLISR